MADHTTKISELDAPLGVGFYFVPNPHSKRNNNFRVSKPQKPKKKLKTEKLVKRYTKRFPNIALDEIYATILQFDRDEKKISQKLKEIEKREEANEQTLLALKDVQRTFPNISEKIIRQALRVTKNDPQEACVWLIDNDKIKVNTIFDEKKQKKQNDRFLKINYKDVNLQEVVLKTQEKRLKNMDRELLSFQERKSEIENLMNLIQMDMLNLTNLNNEFKKMSDELVELKESELGTKKKKIIGPSTTTEEEEEEEEEEEAGEAVFEDDSDDDFEEGDFEEGDDGDDFFG